MPQHRTDLFRDILKHTGELCTMNTDPFPFHPLKLQTPNPDEGIYKSTLRSGVSGELEREQDSSLIFNILPRVNYAALQAGTAPPRSLHPCRQPLPGPRVDTPEFRNQNFLAMKDRPATSSFHHSRNDFLPAGIRVAFTLLRSNYRQTSATYRSYGNIRIATPDIWCQRLTTDPNTNDNQNDPRDQQPVHPQIGKNQIVFRPSRLALAQRGIFEEPAERNPGFGYKGDMGSQGYQLQSSELPDEDNCALWLRNMSLQCSERELFDKINTGAVSILHFYDPTEAHETKAAKLVFMTPQGAAKFKHQCRSTGGIWIRGKKLFSWYNRDGYRRHPQPSQSRVLHVNGPRNMMVFEKWDEYFRQWCVLQWDGYDNIFEDEDRRIMEFRFSRIDGQAQTCLQAITADEMLRDIVWAYYGHDPCDTENTVK